MHSDELSKFFNYQILNYIIDLFLLMFVKANTREKKAMKHEILSSHHARKTHVTLYYEATKNYSGTKANAGISQDKTMKRNIGRDKEKAR